MRGARVTYFFQSGIATIRDLNMCGVKYSKFLFFSVHRYCCFLFLYLLGIFYMIAF